MILSMFIFIFVVVVFAMACHKAKIFYFIVTKMIGIILVVFSGLLYIIKFSAYTTMLPTERSLYLMLFNIKLGIKEIALMGTLGVVLFLVSTVLFLWGLRKRTIIRYILLYIPILVFFSMNLSGVQESIYLNCIRQGMSRDSVNNIGLLIRSIGTVIVLSYIMIPYISIIRQYIETKLYEIKKELIASAFVWLFLDIIIIAMLFASGMNNYLFFNLDLLKYPIRIAPIYGNMIIPVSTVIALTAVFFLMVKYIPMGKWLLEKQNINFFQEKDESFYMMMHTYKNAFYSIKRYSDYNNNEYSFLGTNEERLNVIRMISDEQFSKINDAMESFKMNNVNVNLQSGFDLIQCVDNAILKSMARNLCEKVYQKDSIQVLGSEYHITEALVCIINNAYDAVEKKDKKRIVITVGEEGQYVYVEVKDNGCGIQRHNINKIFNNFYSTKCGSQNYGLGLAYVKKIIESHNGTVCVKSNPDEFTVVQITLRANRR